MKKLILMMTVLVVTQSSLAIGNPFCQLGKTPLNFVGEFSSIHYSGEACSSVFSAPHYSARHFVTGPTGTGSVLYFLSEKPVAFFSKLSFAGLLGPDCDIRVERIVIFEGKKYRVLIEGLVDREILVAKATVNGVDENSSNCLAQADYTGFYR